MIRKICIILVTSKFRWLRLDELERPFFIRVLGQQVYLRM